MRRLTSKLAVLLMLAVSLAPADPSSVAVEDGPDHAGVSISVELPPEQQCRNRSASGLGCCVFASMQNAGRWHNRAHLHDVLEKIRVGGGWPDKVDKILAENAPDVHAEHHFIRTMEDLQWVKDELAAGKMVCITYGYGERYSMATIAHMVNIVHLDDRWAVFLDNNFPCTPERPNRYEWMAAEEGLRRITHGSGGQGWAYSLDAPPPPPAPTN